MSCYTSTAPDSATIANRTHVHVYSMTFLAQLDLELSAEVPTSTLRVWWPLHTEGMYPYLIQCIQHLEPADMCKELCFWINSNPHMIRNSLFTEEAHARWTRENYYSAARSINNAAVLHKVTSSLVTQVRKYIQADGGHFKQLAWVLNGESVTVHLTTDLTKCTMLLFPL